jgi:hypothetical protein
MAKPSKRTREADRNPGFRKTEVAVEVCNSEPRTQNPSRLTTIEPDAAEPPPNEIEWILTTSKDPRSKLRGHLIRPSRCQFSRIFFISGVAASVSEWQLIHSLTLAATRPIKPKQAPGYRTHCE